MDSEFLFGISGTAGYKHPFLSVKVGQGNRRLCHNLCVAGWQKGCRYLPLRCLYGRCSCKGLISVRYSFLVVFTCPLRNKPCRDVQDCDGFGARSSTSEDTFCKLIVWSLVSVPSSVGAEHRFGILSKLFIHPRCQWVWHWWMQNTCSSRLLYVLHLISKSCSVEYWSLLAHSVQDIISWSHWGGILCQDAGGLLWFWYALVFYFKEVHLEMEENLWVKWSLAFHNFKAMTYPVPKIWCVMLDVLICNAEV